MRALPPQWEAVVFEHVDRELIARLARGVFRASTVPRGAGELAHFPLGAGPEASRAEGAAALPPLCSEYFRHDFRAAAADAYPTRGPAGVAEPKADSWAEPVSVQGGQFQAVY